jgi:hypothetical protein
MKKPGMVRVIIGQPIAVRGRDVREVNREVQEWIEATVKRLHLEPMGDVRLSQQRSA